MQSRKSRSSQERLFYYSNFGQAGFSFMHTIKRMETKNQSNTAELTNQVGRRLDESTDGAALARDAHYSRFHFQRIFRQMTGETPSNCRRRLRLERAAYHLLQSDRSVTEIAFESGYGSLEGFSRAFRKVTS